MSNEKEPKKSSKDDDSDCEIEGMDLEDDEEVMDVDEAAADSIDNDDEPGQDDEASNEETAHKLEQAEHDEMEAAKREQMELMEAERQQVAAKFSGSSTSKEDQLQYLLAQSEVFAHFLAGTRMKSLFL